MIIRTAPTKILAPARDFILITTGASYNEPGPINWYPASTHPTEHDAICALLAMDSSMYTHAKIVKVDLPAAAVPNDLETITGELTQ